METLKTTSNKTGAGLFTLIIYFLKI